MTTDAFITRAREFAQESAALYTEALRQKYRAALPPEVARSPTSERLIRAEAEIRESLVVDCYLTGCVETLERLRGNTEPEPWIPSDETAEQYYAKRIESILSRLHNTIEELLRPMFERETLP